MATQNDRVVEILLPPSSHISTSPGTHTRTIPTATTHNYLSSRVSRSSQDDVRVVDGILTQQQAAFEEQERRLNQIHQIGGKQKSSTSYGDPFERSGQHEIQDPNGDQVATPPQNWLTAFRQKTRAYWAEFFGTATLVFFGIGVNHQVGLSTSSSLDTTPRGDNATVCLGWGVALMAGLYISSGISGGHINPAVTIALATFRGFPWKKVPGYILSQVAGAFVGAALVYTNYSHAISLLEGSGARTIERTGGFYFGYPLAYVSNLNCFFNEFIATLVLVLVLMAVQDRGNVSPSAGLVPVIMLWIFVAIASTMGMQTNFVLNPARDIGPRLLTWVVGYSRKVWTFRNCYWIWCPTLAPICGALVACFLYDSLIGSDLVESPVHKPISFHRPSRKNELSEKTNATMVAVH